ncbi:Ger(x)C family spore germination protein [Paenibacillus vini]|uniref:Ger(x)C family spore germination protein n=1 Tax=Paenibacillus vini TaxID=1476024 RepID=UPI0025B67BB4|nr:Ger(x)C family spore germination protein [Paenibacillus vini]MDN4070460.1 Ger(x)C family spore germination protein [Paenibacillus vini]
MRQAVLGCIILIVCLMITGCWNRTELNEIGITIATGFDRQDGKWVMSYQIIVPSSVGTGQGGGGGGANPSIHVFSTKGETIREAADLGYVENPRRLYFGHTDVLIIGKEAAKEGLMQILDLYFRNIDARETVLVAITDGKAKDILKKLIPPEKMPGAALSEILRKETSFSSIFPLIKMYQLAQKITSDSGAAGVPEIRFTGGESRELESQEAEKLTSSPGKLKISRLGVFRREHFVGWMNRQESFGISWLSDQVKGSTISFGCTQDDLQHKNSSFRVITSKTKVTPEKVGDHYKMKIRIKAAGNLLEFQCKDDLTKPESIRIIERNIEKEILDYIDTGWKASKKMRVDLPGFADKVHRKYPNDWRKIKGSWPEHYENIELDVQVKVSVKRPGLFKKSFKNLTKEFDWKDGS